MPESVCIASANARPSTNSIDTEATVIAMFSDDGFGNGGVKLSDGQVDWLKTCLQRAKQR